MNDDSCKNYPITEKSKDAPWVVSRRDFLKAIGYTTMGLSIHPACNLFTTGIRFGIVTDAHYSDRDFLGNRYYRESAAKMRECVKRMNEEKVSFLIELGDFKDQDSPPTEESTISFLQTIEEEFQMFKGDKFHVLGNHDVDSISKDQFLTAISNTNISPKSKYYSFDLEEFHLIVLDANFRSDGRDYDAGNYDWTDANIPQAELDWLDRDLSSTSKPSIVFVHQQLDGTGDHYIKNAAEVREILQKQQRVLAVFQGHNHAGDYKLIEGIHYYTLKAMVEGNGEENNSYAIVEIHDDLGMTVTGYRQAISKNLNQV
jgi:predicted phosphodiesterase